jgi:hypothetical protein
MASCLKLADDDRDVHFISLIITLYIIYGACGHVRVALGSIAHVNIGLFRGRITVLSMHFFLLPRDADSRFARCSVHIPKRVQPLEPHHCFVVYVLFLFLCPFCIIGTDTNIANSRTKIKNVIF